MNHRTRTRNICLTIAYDGTDFHGWQRQLDQPTVQGCLETAIRKIVGKPVTLWGSGRTDAGVHASHQVANFRTTSRIPCSNLVTALNDLIAPTVRVKKAWEVRDTFHARYDVRAKTYWYRILQTPICCSERAAALSSGQARSVELPWEPRLSTCRCRLVRRSSSMRWRRLSQRILDRRGSISGRRVGLIQDIDQRTAMITLTRCPRR